MKLPVRSQRRVDVGRVKDRDCYMPLEQGWANFLGKLLGVG